MTGIQGQNVSLRYLCFRRGEVSTRFSEADSYAVLHGLPVRKPPTYRNQRNYPGLFWSSTTGALLIYESLLELDCLWLKDSDPAVEWIATQPFEMTGWCAGRSRRHVPDVMLRTTSGRVRVVDVKPEYRLEDPDTAAVFQWTGEVCASRGWDYEVWSGASPELLRNTKFLGAARRRPFANDDALTRLLVNFSDGRSLGETVASIAAPNGNEYSVRTALLHLLWCGVLVFDMESPLNDDTFLFRGSGELDVNNV